MIALHLRVEKVVVIFEDIISESILISFVLENFVLTFNKYSILINTVYYSLIK